jgi:dTDP-4-dehydrorhamnose reductase
MPARPRLLLTGKNGQVGWELQRTLAPLGEVIALGSQELDLRDPAAIRATLRELQPAIVVNPAAHTAVDRAETERDAAFAINATAPGVLAEEAARLGALLVHYSTDYVFDGTKTCAYTENDAPNPLNVYGASKLAGERAIAATGCRHLILRTSWVYGARGGNFLLTMLRLGKERDELSIVNDQTGAPTWSRAIAETTAQILAQRHTWPQGAGGVYHLACGGETTWFGFAQAIFAHAQKAPRLVPITSADYPLPARRPANSRLDCRRLEEDFGLAPPDWRQALRLCLEEPALSGRGT